MILILRIEQTILSIHSRQYAPSSNNDWKLTTVIGTGVIAIIDHLLIIAEIPVKGPTGINRYTDRNLVLPTVTLLIQLRNLIHNGIYIWCRLHINQHLTFCIGRM